MQVDTDGVAWDALYTLETQADGSLKISACILKKDGDLFEHDMEKACPDLIRGGSRFSRTSGFIKIRAR